MNQITGQQIEETVDKISIYASEEIYDRLMRNIDCCVEACEKYDLSQIRGIYLASINTAVELSRVILTESLIKLFCDEPAKK